MKWKPYDQKDDPYSRYVVVSDAGYSIMQCVVGETPVQRFVAFKGLSGSSEFKVLGGYGSQKDAKTACEAHFAQTREIAA